MVFGAGICTLNRGLDLSMQVIWNLLVKGLQSYCPSNSENDSTPVELKPRPSVLASTLAEIMRFALQLPLSNGVSIQISNVFFLIFHNSRFLFANGAIIELRNL